LEKEQFIQENMCDYQYLDDFIATHKPEYHMSCLSGYLLKRGKPIYNEMKISQDKSAICLWLGSTGQTNYALYRCKEQNIYLMVVGADDTVKDYLKIDVNNEHQFDL
jgi:hypothetical protein